MKESREVIVVVIVANIVAILLVWFHWAIMPSYIDGFVFMATIGACLYSFCTSLYAAFVEKEKAFFVGMLIVPVGIAYYSFYLISHWECCGP